ncbi:DUF2726 domain-containing protein [Rhodobacter sp. NTK016B]|uniref:DUF2726 domain-containing protein n=1 Tax=Rhodobacter sp. NTK016B TaxID=2759676 RepID=UPI001A8E5537|nr:DUF2726 domain-containing protein [Rhodobacter sp. NTK016B]MBN8294244.1 DUF2726 domain-containing protein [Rhodobacter sp. NTK016B]
MERISVSTGGLFDVSHPLLDGFWISLGHSLILLGGIVLVMSFLISALKRWIGRRRRGERRGRKQKAPAGLSEFAPGNFTVRALLNQTERRLHRDLADLVPVLFDPGARLLSQVSLSSFLYAREKRDWYTISAKYADFVVTSISFEPLCVIEYQGGGHFGTDQGAARDARRRDWEKRRALRLANVPLIEVPARYDRQMLADLLSDVTGRRLQSVECRVPVDRPDLPAEA